MLAACGLCYEGEGASVLGWEKWKASPSATLSFPFLEPRQLSALTEVLVRPIYSFDSLHAGLAWVRRVLDDFVS